MANETLKAERIVEAAVLLLQREIVLPRLVWRQADADFVGAKDDTITLRVPAVLDARTRTMRSDDALVADEFAETAVPVKLDTHVYSLLKVRDEELTLDIRDFARQVLAPQIRAVAEGMEDAVASALASATAEADPVTFVEGSDEPFDVLVDARRALNLLNVPMEGRVLLVGANVEAAILKSDHFNRVDQAGTDSALREATLARAAGFTIVTSNAIDPDAAWAFHRTAIAMGIVAPALPDGAPSKARVALEGLAMRYLRDYAPENSTGPVDRTLVDSFVGAASVEDGDSGSETNKRIVEIDFTGAGS
ncbi:MAG TPA: P22 phage major capsid protein family protein [Acidimicrobiales bacterium]|nr:P22 phage major capsid protein family protein [Acidimicrobiales bacterium]